MRAARFSFGVIGVPGGIGEAANLGAGLNCLTGGAGAMGSAQVVFDAKVWGSHDAGAVGPAAGLAGDTAGLVAGVVARPVAAASEAVGLGVDGAGAVEVVAAGAVRGFGGTGGLFAG